MEPIALCKHCRSGISVFDVVREKDVKNVPTHCVVTYKCPGCGILDRLVAENQSWHSRKNADELRRKYEERVYNEFMLDLELFDNVGELQVLWRSYKTPPPLERGRL